MKSILFFFLFIFLFSFHSQGKNDNIDMYFDTIQTYKNVYYFLPKGVEEINSDSNYTTCYHSSFGGVSVICLTMNLDSIRSICSSNAYYYESELKQLYQDVYKYTIENRFETSTNYIYDERKTKNGLYFGNFRSKEKNSRGVRVRASQLLKVDNYLFCLTCLFRGDEKTLTDEAITNVLSCYGNILTKGYSRDNQLNSDYLNYFFARYQADIKNAGRLLLIIIACIFAMFLISGYKKKCDESSSKRKV